jgi:uncharacterized membrane protein YciS (DUF1049 family)
MWFLLRLYLTLLPAISLVALIGWWHSIVTNTGMLKMGDTEARILKGVLLTGVSIWWFIMGFMYLKRDRVRIISDELLKWKYLSGLGWSLLFAYCLINNK